jgi:hypothetical protein
MSTWARWIKLRTTDCANVRVTVREGAKFLFERTRDEQAAAASGAAAGNQ